MLIQCLIEREGDTHITRLENVRYKFQRNEQGDMVCDVHNKEHINWMLKSASYQEYVPSKVVQDGHNHDGAMDLPVAESPELRTPMMELVGQNAYAPHYGQSDETEIKKPAKNGKRKAA